MGKTHLEDLIESVYGKLVTNYLVNIEAEYRANLVIELGRDFSDAEYAAIKRDRGVAWAWREMAEQERWEWVSLYCPEVLRPVLELHDPFGAECPGCDPGSYAESGALAPCETALLVEQLTVEAAYATP